jgi:hypothetical protein
MRQSIQERDPKIQHNRLICLNSAFCRALACLYACADQNGTASASTFPVSSLYVSRLPTIWRTARSNLYESFSGLPFAGGPSFALRNGWALPMRTARRSPSNFLPKPTAERNLEPLVTSDLAHSLHAGSSLSHQRQYSQQQRQKFSRFKIGRQVLCCLYFDL